MCREDLSGDGETHGPEFGLHLKVVKIQRDTKVRGAVKVDTTEAGRTRWTTKLAEPGWRPLRLHGRRPGGDHGVGRARWSHRSW